MPVWTLETLARISATGLVNSIAVGALVAAMAWAFLKLGGRRSSRTRFAVWLSALFLMASLPWVGALTSRESGGLQQSGSALALPSSWAANIFYVWAIGAGLALLRVGIAFWQLLKLRWSCEAIPSESLPSNVAATVRAAQRVRGTTLCISDQVRVPTAVGFLKPLIAVPRWALEELSSSELDAVLIHELEHLRRHDDWTNLAQKLLRALLFFHPAVWWIDRNLALEREVACDDAVLAHTGDRHGYAACLVTVAEKSLVRRGLALAQAAVSKVQQTTLRVTQILQGDRSPARRVWKPASYALGVASLCGLLVLSDAPPLVEFQSAPVTTVATASELPANAAFFVPAKFVTSTLQRSSAHALPARTKRKISAATKVSVAKNQAVAPELVAKLGQATEVVAQQPQAPQQAVAVQAGLTTDSAPHAVLLVFHGEQSNQYGTSYWTICVWQVDALGKIVPDQQKKIPAKSI